LLYSVQAPAEGGETLFASGYALWGAQPEAIKLQLESLRVRYDFDQLLQRQAKLNDVPLERIRQKWRTRFLPVEYPLVRIHPVTQRKALWVTWAEMDTIIGMSHEDSLSLVMELLQRGTTSTHVYAHPWRKNDLVVWDNRCMLHTTTPYTYESDQRFMYRVGLNGNLVGI
jgi:taurine dioxygenase